jgi:probable rRNA maturation factor
VVRVERLGRPKLTRVKVERLGNLMLAELGLEHAELSVLLTGDDLIEELNRSYRRERHPTDVLAFPMDESPPGSGPRLLGDVVISLETAGRQAKKAGHSLSREVTTLLAHGLAHLVGHDHVTKAEKAAMDALTELLVAVAGRRRPRGPTRKAGLNGGQPRVARETPKTSGS